MQYNYLKTGLLSLLLLFTFTSAAPAAAMGMVSEGLTAKEQKKFNKRYERLIEQAERARLKLEATIVDARENYEGDEELARERRAIDRYTKKLNKLRGRFDRLVAEYHRKIDRKDKDDDDDGDDDDDDGGRDDDD